MFIAESVKDTLQGSLAVALLKRSTIVRDDDGDMSSDDFSDEDDDWSDDDEGSSSVVHSKNTTGTFTITL